MTQATKSRKATTTNKTVLVLNRYFIHRNKSVVLHVRNGENKEYYVTLNANGSTGCTCKAGEHGQKCYHIAECQKYEAARSEARLQEEVTKIALEAEKQAEIAEDDDACYGKIVNGKLVNVRWEELSAQEQSDAYSNYVSLLSSW